MTRSFFQLLAGDTVSAESSANAAFELGSGMNYTPAFSTFGAQLMEIRRQQGRLDEVVELAARGVEEYETLPGWNSALAVLYAELGRLDEVRPLFDAAATMEFGGVPRDVTWLLALACWADCAADLGRDDVAPFLIERLAPYSRPRHLHDGSHPRCRRPQPRATAHVDRRLRRRRNCAAGSAPRSRTIASAVLDRADATRPRGLVRGPPGSGRCRPRRASWLPRPGTRPRYMASVACGATRGSASTTEHILPSTPRRR